MKIENRPYSVEYNAVIMVELNYEFSLQQQTA